MGNRRADGKNERRRSVRLADADARAPRQQVADLPDRKPHAAELRSLNGLGAFKIGRRIRTRLSSWEGTS